jgi:hypothetical protein
MKSELKTRELHELAEAYSGPRRDLRVNPEYQRGTVWGIAQQQALIDSLLRGYQIPIFYVHLEESVHSFTGGTNVTAWLVDGQQRLAAIASFLKNEFGLPDPTKEMSGTVIPTLLLSLPAWHGKKFDELPQEDRDRLLNRKLLVVEMREEAKNEVRDLFIRLQGGTPLTAQEKRDAWPGNFTLFVIRHAGKPAHRESNPKPFFKLVMRGKGKPLSVDDGDHYIDGLADTRKFFAGLAMTIMVRARSGEDFVDLKGKTINEFYKDNLDLQADDPAAVRVEDVLDVVAELPGFEELLARRAMSFQMAFHLALLVDSLHSGDYVQIWRDDVVKAFIAFQDDVAKARQHYKETGESLPHYEKFVALLGGSGSDTAELIRRRHAFFLEKVYPIIRVKPRDEQRLFDALEREVIWIRDGRKCKNPNCGRAVTYREANIHHVEEHTIGGVTKLENGILICSDCHQDRRAMQSLAPVFKDYLRQVSNPLPKS